jgi:drug/metabolite transporter (DMT)-like permease
LPFAILYLWLIASLDAAPLPRPNGAFALYGAIGGLAQVLASFLLLRTFDYRNFAVGTTYSKTETVQTVLVGMVLLGEFPSPMASLGIVISLAGVMAISAVRTDGTLKGVLSGIAEKPALIGLASGGLFGIAAVCYRGAALALDSGGIAARAGLTLVSVLVFQTLVMTVYLAVTDRAQIAAVFREWRWTVWVGVMSMIGSACWFTAMTLQNAAYVRALGQIELVFTFAASALFFREKTTPVEFTGIVLVVGGILTLLLF